MSFSEKTTKHPADVLASFLNCEAQAQGLSDYKHRAVAMLRAIERAHGIVKDNT